MLVTLLPSIPEDNDRTTCCRDNNNNCYTLHNLPDPATGQCRPYFISGNTIYEITAIHGVDPSNDNNNYQSFAVNNAIIANGTLYTITAMDPLFWLLSSECTSMEECNATILNPSNHDTEHSSNSSDRNQHQWQPLSQIKQQYPTIVTDRIVPSQYQHIFIEYNNGENEENESYWKLSMEKVLQWLHQKQKAVANVLTQQQLILWESSSCSSTTTTTTTSCNNGRMNFGAFQKGFNLGGEEMEAEEYHESPLKCVPSSSSSSSSTQSNSTIALASSTTNTIVNPKGILCAATKTKILYESIQIVTNYLSMQWQCQFLDYLHLEKEIVLMKQPQKQKYNSANTNTHQEMNHTTKQQQQPNLDTTRTKARLVAAAIEWNPTTANNTAWKQDNNGMEGRNAQKKIKLQQQPITAGAKRLQKVNKKGLQKMSAFFALKPKK